MVGNKLSSNHKDMFQNVTQILNPLLDLFFPSFCLGCNKKGEFFCWECLERAASSFSKKMGIVRRSEANSVVFEEGEGELDGLVVAMNYEDVLVRRVLKTFKYAFVKDLSDKLAGVLSKAISEAMAGEEVLVTYVPLHEKREKWRGFNQAEVLARGVAGEECIGLLKRVKETESQAELRRVERFKNMKDAFEVTENIEVAGAKVVIVDDVSTTGATLAECAKVLKEAGAVEVIGLVLAKRK